MPTAGYARTMARYGAWQNAGLTTAASTLDAAARRMDRGAFFGSIEATLNHLLWGDRMWLHRFAATPKPARASIAESVSETDGWPAYHEARAAMDRAVLDWAQGLDDPWFDGDLTWYSGAAGREVSKPKAMLVTHFFNHATHHRGQVHAMLTAAGAAPCDTDLFLMPE